MMKNRSRSRTALAALLFATAFVGIAAAPFSAITGGAQAQIVRVESNWQQQRHDNNWHERSRYQGYYNQPDIYYSAPPIYYPPPAYYAPRGPSLNLTFPLFR
jgi:hypothetical protein